MGKFAIKPISSAVNVNPTHFVPNKVAGGGGSSKSTTNVVIPKEFAMQPIFNNSTFYKPNTTGSGVGSVRNSRHKKGNT
jgi:hypothetical protein